MTFDGNLNAFIDSKSFSLSLLVPNTFPFYLQPSNNAENIRFKKV